jgi:hypothetical protein
MTLGQDLQFETRGIDELSKGNIQRTIIFYANQTLKTISICYKDPDMWLPGEAHGADDVPYEYLATDLMLIGITGIEDPPAIYQTYPSRSPSRPSALPTSSSYHPHICVDSEAHPGISHFRFSLPNQNRR